MGSDIVIDFVNATKMVEVDMQILRRRAKVVLVGLFGGELPLSLVTRPTRAYKLIGSYWKPDRLDRIGNFIKKRVN